MRKTFFIFTACILLILFTKTLLWAGEIDALVNKLVEKRILNSAEAQIILDETKQEVAKQKAESGDMGVYWKDGLRIQSDDKKTQVKIGGRIMVDIAGMNEGEKLKSEFGKLARTAEFRRARLYLSGTIWDHFIYKVQYDFAGGDADFKDVYMGYKGIPALGTVKVGHFKEPFSLNELISSKYITFMERALPTAFAPGRNLGMAFNNALLGDAKHPRLTWALGGFMDANSFGDANSHNWNLTSRITGLPWYEDNGKKLLHLGLGYSYRSPHHNLRYRQRPECHLAPRFVDTHNIRAKNANLIGVEAAGVYGPFSLQGEFIQSLVNTPKNYYFKGGYLQGSYFLTGENRPYKNKAGVFSRVKPKKNFSFTKFRDGHTGAWELAARWSGINLNSHEVTGGILNDGTLGLNWYLNPNMRIMSNYIYSEREPSGGEKYGNAHIYQMRYQIDF